MKILFFIEPLIEKGLPYWKYGWATVWAKDIINTLINQLWRIISGPIILLLLPIYLNPEIRSWYYPRSNFTSLAKQYFQYGLFKPLVLKKVRHRYQAMEFHQNRYHRHYQHQDHLHRRLYWTFGLNQLVQKDLWVE